MPAGRVARAGKPFQQPGAQPDQAPNRRRSASTELIHRVQAATFEGDPLLVHQLAANPIDNAVWHNVPGGDVHVATRTSGGHGLGLSIVRAIATAHGATIGARALPGGGLAIDVTFPPPPGPRTRTGQK